MSLADNCLKCFGSSNLYDVLGVSQHVSQKELKKAFYKESLICHPDRVPDDKKEAATQRFQILNIVHSILSDKEKRAVYDETGCIDEENVGLEDKSWSNYWRLVFPKLTTNDILTFMEKYKGSEEEIEDLKKCYIRYEGDMNKISETFIGYVADEEEKYTEILKELIKKKEIPDFPKFSKETKTKKAARYKKFKKEAVEAGNIAKHIDESLEIALLEQKRNHEIQFNDMVARLEAKYCKSGKKQKKSK